MSSDKPARKAKGAAVASPDQAQVLSYLKNNPDFFKNNPELLSDLETPGRFGDGVVDLHQFSARMHRDQSARLQDDLQHYKATQDRYHAAVLTLLDARSFYELVHLITHDIAELLRVDVVNVALEGDDQSATGRIGDMGVYVLQPGAVDELLGPGNASRLINGPDPLPEIFGKSGSRQLRSMALARLSTSMHTPDGLLALGVCQSDVFRNEQITPLMNFLARVIETQLRAWLELPA